MIGVIARKEFLCLVRDGRFRGAVAIMLILLLTALLSAYQRHQTLHDAREQAQARDAQQWLDQDAKNPHTAAHFGSYAYKPQGALAFFDSGIDPYAGTTIWMEAHKVNFAQNRPAEDLGAVSRFGELTPAMILQVLLPLVIILLGFSSFAGERDSGTLRQVASLGVGGTDLLWGKLIGIAGAVAVILVPAAAIGGGILLFGLDKDGHDLGARSLILLLSYLVYLLAFLLLTLGVSALARTAKGALVTLVGLWAFAVFLLPRAASDISRAAIPAPTFSEFYRIARHSSANGLEGAEGRLALPESEHVELVRQEVLEQYQVATVRDLPVYWVGIAMQVLEERDYEIYRRFLAELGDLFLAQQRLQDLFGIFSPLQPLRSISMAMTGTSLAEQEEFSRTAQDFRIAMIREMNHELIENTTMRDPLYIAGREVFARVPAYSYAAPTLGQSLPGQLRNILLLLAWCLATGVLAIVGVRRLRV